MFVFLIMDALPSLHHGNFTTIGEGVEGRRERKKERESICIYFREGGLKNRKPFYEI